MKKLFTLIFAFSSLILVGQDYVMYETHYLSAKPGHEAELAREIAKHNKMYHADGPYANSVWSVLNGPRTGQMFFAMGPLTFSQLDGRPGSREHGADWSSVTEHSGEVTNVEYWIRNDDLTFTSSSQPDNLSMSRVRFFEVADDGLFIELQQQIMKVNAKMNPDRSRTMYRKQFQHRDGRNWAVVQSFENWTDYESRRGESFQDTFIAMFGQEALEKFGEQWNEAVVGREDEWRVLLPGLMGGN